MANGKGSSSRTRQAKPDSGGRRLVKADKKTSIGKLAELKSSTAIVVPEIKKVLLIEHDRNSATTHRRSNTIFPSEMARSEWCPKSTYYRMSGLPEPTSARSFGLDNVFSEGNRIHEKWQGWLAETGNLWGDWYCPGCVMRISNMLRPDAYFGLSKNDSSPYYRDPHVHAWKYKEVTLKSTSHQISGHADGALWNHKCLIEIKSMGIGTFRFEAPNLLSEHTYEIGNKKIVDIEGMWKDLHRPLLSHVKQGNIYLFMAEEMGMPFDEIVFLYEFKANQQVKEFRIRKSSDILDPLLDMASQIEYALSIGVPPVCPFGGCAACRAYEGNPIEEKSHYD